MEKTSVRKIVAIGGGEIGRTGYPVETTAVDREIIKLTGKNHPRLLFVPTASGDAPGYVEDVRNHFGKSLGCEIDALLLLREKYSKKEMAAKIMSADIVYVGGGNTLRMMKAWRKLGVDRILSAACEKGVVMAGVSAGSICWFKSGLSDSKIKADGSGGYSKVSGLGFVGAAHSPHYDFEKARPEALKEMMRKTTGVAIAIENCAAMEIVGDEYRVITSKDSAKAFRVFWKRGEYFKEEILRDKDYRPLPELVAK